MLEQRPILQRAVYAGGAFALVFVAAMGGTSVMITGGIGGSGERPYAGAVTFTGGSEAQAADWPSNAVGSETVATPTLVAQNTIKAAPALYAGDGAGHLYDVSPDTAPASDPADDSAAQDDQMDGGADAKPNDDAAPEPQPSQPAEGF